MGKFCQEHFGFHNFLTDDIVRLFCQIKVVPGVITDFVTVFRYRLRAVAILLCPIAGDKESAVNTRAFQRLDQIFEARGSCSGIECDRDLRFATWPSVDLAGQSISAGGSPSLLLEFSRLA